MQWARTSQPVFSKHKQVNKVIVDGQGHMFAGLNINFFDQTTVVSQKYISPTAFSSF